MATTVKSTAITNLDSTPPLQNTAGQGARGELLSVTGSALSGTNAAGTANNIILKLCRIPATAKVKAVYVDGAAQTQGAWDVGLYYSSSANDGTPASQQGTLVPGAQAFFGSAVSFASALNRTDVTNESGTYTADKRNYPIAAATNGTLQISSLSTSQLGGYMDVALTCVGTVQVSGLVGMEVQYTI